MIDKLDLQLAASIRGDFKEGWRLVQELEKERPECNRCAFNRGWYKLSRGEFLEGFSLLDRGRWEGVFGSPNMTSETPILNLSKDDVVGKSILLRNEGGFGDEIINVRFAQDLARKGMKVFVAGHPQLLNLFSTVEGVQGLVPIQLASKLKTDYWAPSMSLPFLVGHSYESLSGKPYITPDITLAQQAREIFSEEKGLKIGVRWSGNPRFEHEQHRKFPPELMIGALQNKKANFYSLEIDKDPLFPEMQDLRPALIDWNHTAAVISCLDLVITSCTSVAHMSASMGVPTWIIVPILPYYIWAIPGDKSVWYDSVTLFRQVKYKNWKHPFKTISLRLDQLISNS